MRCDSIDDFGDIEPIRFLKSQPTFTQLEVCGIVIDLVRFINGLHDKVMDDYYQRINEHERDTIRVKRTDPVVYAGEDNNTATTSLASALQRIRESCGIPQPDPHTRNDPFADRGLLLSSVGMVLGEVIKR